MTLLSWNPAWVTGVPQIDEQHRELLRQFETLLVAIHENRPEERIPELLAFLADYVNTHFFTEEEHMRGTRYPGYVAHKAIQDDMRAQVRGLVEGYDTDHSIMNDQVLVFLTDWLIGHIQDHDRQMAQHLLRFRDQTPGSPL